MPNNCYAEHNGKKYLPCKFNFDRIQKPYKVEFSDSELSSFIGFPEKMNCKLSIIRSAHFEDTTWFPKELDILSWSNIPLEYELYKYIRKLNGFYYFKEAETTYKGLLSFFKIGLTKILYSPFIEDTRLYEAIKIVNKHLQSNECNISACQTELMKKRI
jgi:hypothetical protein